MSADQLRPSDLENIERQIESKIEQHSTEVSRHERIIQAVVEANAVEIRRHKHSIAELRSGLNKLRPIHRLPDEILTEIFMIYAAYCREPDPLTASTRAIYRRARYTWIRVSHVCHRWREVAINFAGLWTYIDCCRPDLTQEWLTRSKAVPLEVRWVGSWPGARAAMKRGIESFILAIQELPRIQHLDIDSPRFNQSYEAFSTSWPECAAPTLRTISLMTVVNWYTAGGGVPIIKRLLDGKPHRLERLSLRDSYLRWSDLKSPVLASLKYFRFSSGPWMDDLGTVLSVLSECVSLEELDLSEMRLPFTTVHPQEVQGLLSINLPNLKRISLSACASVALALIDRLMFPFDSTVELNFYPEANIQQHNASIGSSLTRYFHADPQAKSAPIISFSLQGERCSYLKFDGWCSALTEVPSDTTFPTPDVSVAFDLYEIMQSYTYWTTILDILSTIPLTRVRTLFLGAMHRYAFHTDFRRTLRQMREIETIHLTGWTTRELLRLLYTRSRPHAEDVFLPKLRTLYFHEVSFPMHPRQEADGVELDLFMDRLNSRADHRCPVTKLVLDTCYNLTDGDIAMLRNAVKDLSWDGRITPGSADPWEDPEPDEFDEDDIDWNVVIQLDDDF